MVPLGSLEQSLLYLPEYRTAAVMSSRGFRSVKRLSERVSYIEQYLRDASERDGIGRLSPRFSQTRPDSLAESEGSKGTFNFCTCESLTDVQWISI